MSRKHRKRTTRKKCAWCHRSVPERHLVSTFEGLVCKECLGSSPAKGQPMKICPRCRTEKPAGEFGIRKSRGTFKSWCKVCHNRYNASLRAQPGYKEKHAAYMREYRRREKEETF